MSSSPLLLATGIEKSFTLNGRHTDVLKRVDLSVDAGELVAVVGASGTGKSTLLNILGTLDTPTNGTVRYLGEDMFAASAEARARFRNRSLGFVFQFNQLLPEFNALENAAMPLLVRRERGAMERARVLLDRVGLSHRINHRPAELSGGEQQRVAVARALVGCPQLVLADEPTGNLDSHTGDEVFGLLRQLCQDEGAAVLVVTHNEQLAERCGRTVQMADGSLTPL